MTKKRRVALLVACLLVVAGALYFVFFYQAADPRTAGLTKVQGYNAQGICTALLPECGLCYGQVIDKECYVNKAKLTPGQLKHMGF